MEVNGISFCLQSVEALHFDLDILYIPQKAWHPIKVSIAPPTY